MRDRTKATLMEKAILMSDSMSAFGNRNVTISGDLVTSKKIDALETRLER
jgi:hypothetical protein